MTGLTREDLNMLKESEIFVERYRNETDDERRAAMKAEAVDALKKFTDGELSPTPNNADSRTAILNLILEFMTDSEGELTDEGGNAFDKLAEFENKAPDVMERARQLKNAAIAKLVNDVLEPIMERRQAMDAETGDIRLAEDQKLSLGMYEELKELADNFIGYSGQSMDLLEQLTIDGQPVLEMRDGRYYISEQFDIITGSAKQEAIREYLASNPPNGEIDVASFHDAVNREVIFRCKSLAAAQAAKDGVENADDMQELAERMQGVLADESLAGDVSSGILDDLQHADAIEAVNFISENSEGNPADADDYLSRLTEDVLAPYRKKFDEAEEEPEIQEDPVLQATRERIEKMNARLKELRAKPITVEESPEFKKAREELSVARNKLREANNANPEQDGEESQEIKDACEKVKTAEQVLETLRARADDAEVPEAEIETVRPTSQWARVGKGALSAYLVSFGITGVGHLAAAATGGVVNKATVGGGLGITAGLVSVFFQIRKWHRLHKIMNPGEKTSDTIKAFFNDKNIINAVGPTFLAGLAFGLAMTGNTTLATIAGGAAISWGGGNAAAKNYKNELEASGKKSEAWALAGFSFLAIFGAGFAGKLSANYLMGDGFHIPGTPDKKEHTPGTESSTETKVGTRDIWALTDDAKANFEKIATQWGITDEFKSQVAAYNAAHAGEAGFTPIDANHAYVLAGDAGMRTTDNMSLWSEGGKVNSGGSHTVLTQQWAKTHEVDFSLVKTLKGGVINDDFYAAYDKISELVNVNNQVGEVPGIVRPANMPVMETYARGGDESGVWTTNQERYVYQETVPGTPGGTTVIPGTPGKWYWPAVGMFGTLMDKIPAVRNIRNPASKTPEEKEAEKNLGKAKKELAKALENSGKGDAAAGRKEEEKARRKELDEAQKKFNKIEQNREKSKKDAQKARDEKIKALEKSIRATEKTLKKMETKPILTRGQIADFKKFLHKKTGIVWEFKYKEESGLEIDNFRVFFNNSFPSEEEKGYFDRTLNKLKELGIEHNIRLRNFNTKMLVIGSDKNDLGTIIAKLLHKPVEKGSLKDKLQDKTFRFFADKLRTVRHLKNIRYGSVR